MARSRHRQVADESSRDRIREAGYKGRNHRRAAHKFGGYGLVPAARVRTNLAGNDALRRADAKVALPYGLRPPLFPGFSLPAFAQPVEVL
jgi:hypothetical protein